MKAELFFVLALTVFSFVVRFININNLESLIWDEIHTVGRVRKLLQDEVFFSDHPPFAKLIQLVSVLVFGDNPFGWRMSQTVLGVLLIPVTYLIGKKLFNHKNAGLLAAFFVSFDHMFLTQSILGLNHIYLAFFIAFSFLLFIYFLESKITVSYLFYFLCAVSTGLTIAIKWTGLVLLPVYLLWLFTRTSIKKGLQKKLVVSLLFLIITLVSYLLTFSFEGENFKYYKKEYGVRVETFPQAVISWHKLALGSHMNEEGLKNRHSSSWYTWPIMYKPVWMSFITFGYNNARCVVGFGNPIIWWLGALAVLYQLFLLKKSATKKETVFLLGCYFISYLSFAFIGRPMFMHHYITALYFQLFILEGTFVSLSKSISSLRILPVFLILVIVFLFFYFYPFVTSNIISYSDYQNRLWLESWKYENKGWKWFF